jgi:hypothetical protein
MGSSAVRRAADSCLECNGTTGTTHLTSGTAGVGAAITGFQQDTTSDAAGHGVGCRCAVAALDMQKGARLGRRRRSPGILGLKVHILPGRVGCRRETTDGRIVDS